MDADLLKKTIQERIDTTEVFVEDMSGTFPPPQSFRFNET